MTAASTARRLRLLLARPGIIRSLGAHDALSARLMEQAGLELVFLGGFGVSASRLGLPDVGLLTLTEMADAIRDITAALNIPLVADGDTGHGGLANVARTVEEFERAGAAGLLLEDQASPKRCGHFAGKQVVPAQEMVARLHAALAARRDPDFVVFARTDALAVEGVDAAVARANLYADAGADVCFVEAPATRAELERIPRAVKRPVLANMLTGGKTPILSAGELEALGYKIVVCPVAPLLACGYAIRALVESLLSTGRVDQTDLGMLTFEELKQAVGADAYLES